ncbi:MAG: biopolymer transporter ExbD [Gemmobacter sp.]|nr:biopolymer transporter ExbD [Gemmobacter sp.]
MKLRRAPHRRSPETIVALIDVVFFLLVFFLLIGRMDATAPFAVSPPIAATGAQMPGGGATVSIAGDGSLALDGSDIAQADLLPRLQAMIADRPDLLIRINAHHSAPLRDILPLVAALDATGARDVVLVVTPGTQP